MNKGSVIKPYIPAEMEISEFSIKAIFLGLVMAVILGSANAYLGLKAGMTISATIPAAVISIAAFRLPFFRGTVLEQNTARTAASVGEALVAGAIFTLPAFVIIRFDGKPLWENFHYWESSLILLVGGLLGVLFVIILRRTLCDDVTLPFPESYACAAIVKAGQKGASGAALVFGAMGVGMLLEVLKNSAGFRIFKDTVDVNLPLWPSTTQHFDPDGKLISESTKAGGVLSVTSPSASPALMGIGYIIGPWLSTLNFSGGIIAWLIFIPLIIYFNPGLATLAQATPGGEVDWSLVSYLTWKGYVQPIAVGAMIVGALYTLWTMRKSLAQVFAKAFGKHEVAQVEEKRTEKDLHLRTIFIGIAVLVIPITAIYYYFTNDFGTAIAAAVIMTLAGFLFSAVGGYLVGLVGGSNQPISGLTLSTLVIAALVMLMLGQTGEGAVAAVLAVAAVICCASAMSGDMIQDLKAGQLLGATPWKMEWAEIISTIVVSFILVVPIAILHESSLKLGEGGIGGTKLPAPQAGLMAQLAGGIISNQIPWTLVIIGMVFAIALISIKAPSPMLIAIGMYLPFETTFAVFIGGMIRLLADNITKRKAKTEEDRTRIENRGTLLASGFIAGEAVTGVILAAFVLGGVDSFTQALAGVHDLPLYLNMGGWLSIIIFAIVVLSLIFIPLRKRTAEATE